MKFLYSFLVVLISANLFSQSTPIRLEVDSRSEVNHTVNGNMNINVTKTESLSESMVNYSEMSRNYAEARKNRLQLEESQLRIQKERQKIQEEYERKALKKPELDFNSGFVRKFKIKKPSRKKIEMFIPQTWAYSSENLEKNQFVQIQRVLEDGTTLYMISSMFDQETMQSSPKDIINKTQENWENIPLVQLGVDGKMVDQGYLINKVTEGFGAFNSGLKKGDVILESNGVKIESEDQSIENKNSLFYSYKDNSPGDEIEIVLDRNGELFSTTVKLTQRQGHYYGRLSVNGYDAFMYTNFHEFNNYGEKKMAMDIFNSVDLGDEMLTFQFVIVPKNDTQNWNFEFKRFQKSLSIFMNNVKID